MTSGRGDDRNQSQSNGEGHDERQQSSPSPAERITLAIGIAIILGLIGLVTYFTFFGGNGPPLIEAVARAEDIRSEDGSFYLPIAVSNQGGQTAEDVIVRAALDTGNGAPEEAELTIDFLAAGETIEGTAVFRADPTTGQLTVDVVSFR